MLKSLPFIIKVTLTAIFLILLLMISTGWFFSRHLPDYSQLKNYYPPCVTRIYSADGKLIEEYAKEKRIFVPISSLPKSLVQAFISAEDKNFYHHSGVDMFSVVRAIYANISHAVKGARFEGGSTITQQVVKNFLLSSERSIERKIKEAILSYMISQTLSKDQILELYLNQLFLGKGYGVAAAALGYFNKSVEELSIAESAFLASLPKAPSQYGTEKNYKRALARRNYVIGRMCEDGYITKNEAKESKKHSLKLTKQDKIETINANYYAEQVRSEVISMFGEEYFYTAGLHIVSCLDSKLQESAVNSLHFGIKSYDTKEGYRGVVKNISLDNWQESLKIMPRPFGLKNYKLAVVINVENTQAKIGLEEGIVEFVKLSDMAWAKKKIKSVKEILQNGDIIIVEETKKNHYKLQQIPNVNGSIMVMESYSGRVLASEGGYDYDMSKFDRATQARRQPGSLIKPFVYLTAFENGWKPTDMVPDAPIEIIQNDGITVWKPKNWDNKFFGLITLRQGLEKSRNCTTVRLGQLVGLKKITETFKRFGINDNPSEEIPSIVLGSLETTVKRMTIAYSIIANKGKKVAPHYIELIKDRKGKILYRRNQNECNECKNYQYDKSKNPLPPIIPFPLSHVITNEETSYQIISILMGVIQRGTGRKANRISQIIAGKTGTSNDGKDAWFVGFTPEITIGTYIGYDIPKSLGNKATGSSIALPIFVHFMEKGYKDIRSIDFEVPKSIDLISIDYNTGKPSIDQGSITEAMKTADTNQK